jgi:hypothetical protein
MSKESNFTSMSLAFKKIANSIGFGQLAAPQGGRGDAEEEEHLRLELKQAQRDMRIALESLGGKAEKVISAADKLINNKKIAGG